MADAVATVDHIGQFEHKKRIKYSFELTSVGISATGAEQKLDGIWKEGIIDEIRASCGSTDFDLAIFNKTSGVADSNDEIFRAETENKCFDYPGLGINYQNDDVAVDNALYVVVKNDDGGNATGAITLEIYIDALAAE